MKLLYLAKILFVLCFLPVIFGCEKHEEPRMNYPPKIVTINPTKYNADVRIEWTSTVYTIKAFSNSTIDTYKHFYEGDVCLIGKYADVFIYEITSNGWEGRYEYTCVITDTIFIDSMKFKPRDDINR